MNVSSTKVRRILQVAHEAHEIADVGARFRHMLSSALLLVGADVGCLFVFDSAQPQVPVVSMLEGHTPRRAQAVLSEYAQGDHFDILAQQIRANFTPASPVLARRRQELIDDRSWYASVYVNDFRRWWGFDHSIYSMQARGTAHIGMSVNRSFGSAAFEHEDQELIEILHLAFSRLAMESASSSQKLFCAARSAALPPRARETLDCLLRGASTKDIAAQLAISPNTVHHYCKMVFRAFDVRSRSELLARWHAEA